MQSLKLIKFAVIFLLPLVSFSQNEWKLQKSNNNIYVYFRQKSENTYSIKVETKFNVSSEEVVRKIQDIENYPNWIYRCANSEWLTKNETNKIIRTVSDIPWPFPDRDVISKINDPVYKDNKTILQSKAIPDYIPEKENFKRQQFSEAKWVIDNSGRFNCEVSYYLNLKIYKNIPESILAMITTMGPYKSFKNLKKILEE